MDHINPYLVVKTYDRNSLLQEENRLYRRLGIGLLVLVVVAIIYGLWQQRPELFEPFLWAVIVFAAY